MLCCWSNFSFLVSYWSNLLEPKAEAGPFIKNKILARGPSRSLISSSFGRVRVLQPPESARSETCDGVASREEGPHVPSA